jgi:MATE family multidrug resistance protein
MLALNYRTILGVAVPLMVSSFIQSIVLLTDASFISRYDTNAFDAVGNGGLLYVTLFITLAGLGDATQILIARRIGQSNDGAIGSILLHSYVVHVVLAIGLYVMASTLLPVLLDQIVAHKDLARLQVQFISIRSDALFFAMIALPLQAYFLAQGKTIVVLLAALVTACSNIFLDYVLIFGVHGFPELGIRGAALASTLADGLGMLTLVIVFFWTKQFKRVRGENNFTINKTSVVELVRIGAPICFQGIMALGTWSVFFIWIEQLGKFELTVSQNIRAIYFLVFVPIWGFAGTTKTYISQYMGAKAFDSLKLIQKRIQKLTLIFLFIFFHGAIFYPEALIRFINPNELYVLKSAEILRFISISIFIYGFSSVYFQTINGSGNTKITFLIELSCVIFYVGSAYIFIKVLHWDIYWIWSIEYVYFITMGGLSLLYLRWFDWKSKEL